MKVLIFPLILFLSCLIIYIYSSSKKNKHKKPNPKIIGAISIATAFLLCYGVYAMYKAATAPDTQCTKYHDVAYSSPKLLMSANDYFDLGNYDYDSGNCMKAISDYSISIQLKPNNPESYNNRAYTYMRMQDYKDALADLNKAIELRPNYVQALMNRGDIHNYYYEINRQSAIVDYKKVISLGSIHGTSVCGHLFLAKHNGWNLGTILDFPQVVLRRCN